MYYQPIETRFLFAVTSAQVYKRFKCNLNMVKQYVAKQYAPVSVLHVLLKDVQFEL